MDDEFMENQIDKKCGLYMDEYGHQYYSTVNRQPVRQKQVEQLGIDLNDRGRSSQLSSLVLCKAINSLHPNYGRLIL